MKTLTRSTRKTKAMENPCIWMQSGVVKKKSCNHYYDCATCRFDAGMVKAAATGKHITWQEAMRRFDSTDRTCRHALTGRTGHRNCPMNYNCDHCDFDQALEDTLSPSAARAVTHVQDIKGFRLPSGHFFHTGHTWARIEDGGIIRVGMDDFSFKVLGNPDRMVLPLMGQELNHGETGWGMKRNGNTADVRSPVNGVITKVNPNAMKDTRHMGDDPYSENWLFTIHNSDLKAAVSPLMDDEKSPEWLGREVSGLEEMIETVTGPLAADGGTLTHDVYGNLPTLGWNNLVERFLRT
ncbi:MAG: glycine cleavage system protein H [Desulfobacterales bacterium]|nr:glycine cleavage system protein H [Desulfobacterales bacterium]